MWVQQELVLSQPLVISATQMVLSAELCPPLATVPVSGTAKAVPAPMLKPHPQAMQPASACPLVSHHAFSLLASPSGFSTGPVCWSCQELEP